MILIKVKFICTLVWFFWVNLVLRLCSVIHGSKGIFLYFIRHYRNCNGAVILFIFDVIVHIWPLLIIDNYISK